MTPKEFHPVTHVIFDNDGLLLDTESFYEQAIAMILKRFGKGEYTWEMKLKQMGRPQKDAYKLVIDEYKLPISVEQMIRDTDEFLKQLFPNSQFMPGAERLVTHLHDSGIPLALCTGSKKDYFHLKTSKHQKIYDMFHHVVCVPDEPTIKMGKPSPECYLLTAKRFPTEPRNCVVFEDSLNGVRSAINAGMQVVMVPDQRMEQKYLQEATLCLKSLLEFKPELFHLPPFKSG